MRMRVRATHFTHSPPKYRKALFYSILFYPITLGGRRGTTDEFATIPFPFRKSTEIPKNKKLPKPTSLQQHDRTRVY